MELKNLKEKSHTSVFLYAEWVQSPLKHSKHAACHFFNRDMSGAQSL